ncbi:heavy metal-binding protein HIP-like [Mercenaria mercenaria]|uniref:heavy metal-binding protein HIP-like n=1 Tax=Mercenaria mercenaria TaxID=6596 RepID=UPI00234F80A9|nr:heavy metal-binding protein HIP-like [Mercenaria mercenaria]
MNTVSVIIMCVIYVLLPTDALENEQTCSRFPYEEQMLGKVMKVEAKMEQWDKEMKRFEEVILSVLEHRREETERQLEKFSEENKKLRDEIKNKTKDEDSGNPVIAFNAYTNVSGNYHMSQVVIFHHVLLNEGGGYNETTGKFTAPVAGLYHFTVHVCNQLKKPTVFSIMHGTNTIAVSTEYEDSHSSCSSLSAPVIMEAMEQVYVTSSLSENYIMFNIHRWPSFMGVLVQRRQ